MLADSDVVEVTVSGAVGMCGRLIVPKPATVADALKVAGGFSQAERRWPLGVLTVRRPAPTGERLWRFDTATRAPEEWEDFPLEHGDLVTVHRVVEARGR